jgi:hypothetical protein
MAELSRFFWDSVGHAHTNALHWEGFPHLLWESLQMFGYTEPPPYDGIEYDEEDVPRCRVKMTIPPHPTLSLWQPIEVNVVGHRLADTFKVAAMEAIRVFCDLHPEEVAGHPISLFPAMDPHDPEWTFRVTYCDHLLGNMAGETLRTTVRFMNAQYRYQTLQQHGIYQLTSIAQGYRTQIGWQNTQIEELQATVTAKDEIITQRDETIQHREDQIVESDALIVQRDTIINFLQEQVHELNLNLGQAIDHINMLHEQPVHPDVKKKKNLKKSKESPRSTLSMEILFLVLIIPLPVVSHPWATLMTFSSFELMTS